MTIPTLTHYSMPSPQAFPQSRVNWPLKPSRAALLVHDMQTYFIRFYGENNPVVAQLLHNIAALCQWARINGVPVIYTAQPHQQSPQERGLLTDVWGSGLTTETVQMQAICSALAPQPADYVLQKWRYSAFQRTPLESLLNQHGRDQLLICGVYSHIGCHATALEAFMKDIKPFFIADAQADFSEAHHHAALALVASTCGRLVSTQSILSSNLETV